MSGDDTTKEGWLDIEFARHVGPLKWKKKKERRCVLTTSGVDSRLVIYKRDGIRTKCDVRLRKLKEAVMANTSQVSQDSARCTVEKMDGGTLCVMSGSDDVIKDWVVSLNTAIKAARCIRDHRQEGTSEGGTTPAETSADSKQTGSKMATASKKRETSVDSEMESAASPPKKQRKIQTSLIKEGRLDLNIDCQPGTDKWDKANSKERYCKLQRGNGLSLEVSHSDRTSHTLHLDTALKADKMGRCEVVTEDGTVLCVMEGNEQVISCWVDALNSVITPDSTDEERDTDTDGEIYTDSDTDEVKDAGTAPFRSRELSEKPKLIKQGWLKIYTDPALDENKESYCMLQRQGDCYRVEVYTQMDHWRNRDQVSKSYTYRTGSVATVCLDTARHAQLCSTQYEVVKKDGGTLCVMDGTDDVMTDWVVSLNRAIMAARCQGQTGNSESHGDDCGDNSDVGTLEQRFKAMSPDESKKEFLQAWFPELDGKSYMIPRVHYGTVHSYKKVVGGITVEERKHPKNANDVTSIVDVLKQVHDSMNTIKEKIASSDRMVIMTEVKCSLYKSIYAGATDWNNNINNTERGGAAKVSWDMKRDLADLLVIHRDRGLLLGAVIRKTGSNVEALWVHVKNALNYLDKAEAVVMNFIPRKVDGGPAAAVNKTILLPNLTRANLQNPDTLQPQVMEWLERCVGVQCCLTKDDMADEQRLEEWWTACLKRDTQGDTAMMGEEVYRTLVEKFVVPRTTVEIWLGTQPRLQLWTAGHVVNAVGEEHGRDLTRIALFPLQVELLDETPDDDDDDDVRILYGGPGTGKTILLLLRGVSWSRDGCDRVFNIQTEYNGQAAAYLVSHQLRETVARARQGDTVARPDFTVQHVNMAPWRKNWNTEWTQEGMLAVAAWCDDAARSKNRKVHIIADEVNGDIISHLYRELKDRRCTVKLWAAGVDLRIPDDMERYVREITDPLRLPPSVVREVEQHKDMACGYIPRYSKPPVAPPCDGPPVITITHFWCTEGHQAEGGRNAPWRCEECGRRVAHTLLHTLHLGRHDNGPGEQGGLRYNDVFIMGASIDCSPDTPDDDKKSPAPFIRGLRQLGIPTCVVDYEDSEAVRRVAENRWTPPAVADAVTIVQEDTVWGLERKVVVYLNGFDGYYIDAELTGRLFSMSRSTAQVILVD